MSEEKAKTEKHLEEVNGEYGEKAMAIMPVAILQDSR